MHHALGIADILRAIFQHTDTRTDISCAQVCRSWHENVLDVLWYRVDRLDRLLRILAPMSEVNQNVVAFTQYHIPAAQWKKFSFYANRVRQIECGDKSPAVHHQSFATLAITRPVLHLFPNLSHLTWTKDAARPTRSLVISLLFLHPGLSCLTIWTGFSATQGDLFAIDNFFNDVLLRAPSIQALDFRSGIPFRSLGPALAGFLRGLRELKHVLLSDAMLSSDVISALGYCPQLEAIRLPDVDDWTAAGSADVDDLENFYPVVDPGAFPCLREMSFKAHLWNAARFLQSQFPASRLRILHVKTLQFESPDNIGSFFEALARICPSIEAISLTAFYRNSDNDFEPISFSTLEPLLMCTSLSVFSLVTPSPLNLDDAQAVQLASCWPSLQKLVLNPLPFPHYSSPHDHLSFAATIPFAEKCPNLRHLEFYACPAEIPPPAVRKAFRRLEKFVVGTTTDYYSAEELALFLTDITPPTCAVTATASFSMLPLAHDAYLQEQLVSCGMKLKQVLAMLPILRKVHAQYRGRLQALEQDVKRLTLAATATPHAE